MLDRMRDRLGIKSIRRAVQAKLAGTVDEVLRRHQVEQTKYLEEQISKLRDEVHLLTNRTVDRVHDLEMRIRRDIVFAGEHNAAREASEFAREHMVSAQHCRHPHQTLEYGLSLAPEGGMALEFGVFSGTTLKIISSARGGKEVYGFDSFQGLPADWRAGYPAGTFSVDGLPDVPGAELVVGLFEDTLPGFLESHAGPVDFLHVDGDLYSSAKTVLDLAGPRLREGSVIVFDEFFNYPGWQEHEYKAWREYVERTGIQFSYRAYTWDNEQVVVQITGL
ncbi:MAG TPA: class I SAM-dependent methyltransferase [Actinophytocola sp.]|uniref:class I SAM-dependent methyltransferase n=1 Tax=Actinophytocola sp. TaxID=1872138 RepID=UPI002DDCAA6B|nr:class I SAM-dependent methyltransferase [Actinophytocola sp.]HEV2777921.1 class I SAM-dependent methyltransferase [Actinophytocola sp.]